MPQTVWHLIMQLDAGESPWSLKPAWDDGAVVGPTIVEAMKNRCPEVDRPYLMWCIAGDPMPAYLTMPGTECVRRLSVIDGHLVTKDREGRIHVGEVPLVDTVNPEKPSDEDLAKWREIEKQLGYWKDSE